jgi:hypothetical protein
MKAHPSVAGRGAYAVCYAAVFEAV